MKALSQIEIETLLGQFTPLLGSQLNQIYLDSNQLQLSFWSSDQGEKVWIFDFSRSNLPFLLLDSRFTKKRSVNKPLGLFMKAHAVGLSLQSFGLLPELGRIVSLHLSDFTEKNFELHFWMIPGSVNLQATSEGKTVSLFRPRVLNQHHDPSLGDASRPHRELAELISQWKELSALKEDKKKFLLPINDEKNRRQKLEKSIKKVEAELVQKLKHPFRRLARQLELSDEAKLDPEMKCLMDSNLSRIQNIDLAYTKAKSIESKIPRTQQRLDELKAQLRELDEKPLNSQQAMSSARAQSPPSSSGIWKGRTLKLDESTVVRFGKSARDNMELLRQARPWYLWFHLKDYPSSHGVLQRHKNRELTSQELVVIGRQLLEITIKDASQRRGAWDLIFSEVRFVRPTKKKMGQVTVSKFSTLRFRDSD